MRCALTSAPLRSAALRCTPLLRRAAPFFLGCPALDLGRALALSVRFFEANDANPTGCYAATLLSSAAAVTKAGVQVASRRRSHGLQISQRHPDRWEASKSRARD